MTEEYGPYCRLRLFRWLRAHGGAVDEHDFDAQRDFEETFLKPLVNDVRRRASEAAWNEGYVACHLHIRDGLRGDLSIEPSNPYRGGAA